MSSISVSLDGAEVVYCVFLVFTGMVSQECVQLYNKVGDFQFWPFGLYYG